MDIHDWVAYLRLAKYFWEFIKWGKDMKKNVKNKEQEKKFDSLITDSKRSIHKLEKLVDDQAKKQGISFVRR